MVTHLVHLTPLIHSFFFGGGGRSGSGERRDVRIEAGLVPGCLVLVQHALGYHAVEYRHGSDVCRASSICILGINCSDHPLDCGARHGALTGVLPTSFFRLSDTFAGLRGIGQRRLQ